jgi:hypothetical protein
MEELVGIGIFIAIIVAILKFALSLLFSGFGLAVNAVGHPAMVVLIMAGLGALLGLWRHSRRDAVVASSDADFAQIWGIRLQGPHWAKRATMTFVMSVALYGTFLL